SSFTPRTQFAEERYSLWLRLSVPRHNPALGQRQNAAHAGGEAAFGDDEKRTDLAGVGDVRAAAEFLGEPSDLDDTDEVAILLAEERHRPGRERFLERQRHRRHRQVGEDVLVDDLRNA